MASSIATSLLCRTARFPLLSAIFPRNFPAFFYSSMASSSLSPPPMRTFLCQKLVVSKPFTFITARFASSKLEADENLEKVLQSEIESTLEAEEQGREINPPEGFPFEIIDNSGDQTIILKREFSGENIEATVFANFDDDMSEDTDDDSEVEDQATTDAPNLSLLVSIDKGEGSVLEISCSITSQLEIEGLIMKKAHDSDDQGAYQGPEFSDLDEKLQKAFYNYLEARGIDSSLRDFLHEYMMSKNERENLTWLKNMKEFVGSSA